EAFEKALEVNPKSAAAHFELAILFEKNETDAAAAIYHYDQYLKLRPRADNAEIVRQHITSCKQVLARTVSLGPVSERQQREFEALADENKKLHEEVEKWKLSASRSQGATNTAGPAQSSRDSREAAVLARATQNSGSGFSAGAVESSAAGASRPASLPAPA